MQREAADSTVDLKHLDICSFLKKDLCSDHSASFFRSLTAFSLWRKFSSKGWTDRNVPNFRRGFLILTLIGREMHLRFPRSQTELLDYSDSFMTYLIISLLQVLAISLTAPCLSGTAVVTTEITSQAVVLNVHVNASVVEVVEHLTFTTAFCNSSERFRR